MDLRIEINTDRVRGAADILCVVVAIVQMIGRQEAEATLYNAEVVHAGRAWLEPVEDD